LTPELQAICQKPNQFVQNREPVLDETIDQPDFNKYQYSNEIPANLTFVDQGSEYHNQHLDASQEGRYLREYCVQHRNKNYFLYLKGLINLRHLPEWENPEKLAAILDIPFNLAFRLADALSYLEFDYVAYKSLMKEFSKASKATVIIKIEQYTLNAEMLKEVTVEWENHMVVADPEQEYLSQYVSKIDNYINEDELPEDNGANNPYGAYPLENGKDSLPYEFQVKLDNADFNELTRYRKNMFPAKNANGKWCRPKYHYFTDGMRNHFWTIYYRRKDELKELAEKPIPIQDLSDDAKVALEWIESLGKGRITAALIYAAKEGSSMNLFGMKVEFSRPLPQPEVATLWNAYASI
jgi:hypothetical protein